MSVVEIALTAEQLSDEERRSFLEAACADRLRGRLQAFPHQARLDEGIEVGNFVKALRPNFYKTTTVSA